MLLWHLRKCCYLHRTVQLHTLISYLLLSIPMKTCIAGSNLIFHNTKVIYIWVLCSSLGTPQPDLPSWRSPQWQHHTDLGCPSAPQWCYPLLSATAAIYWWGGFGQHNDWQHYNSAIWPDPWYPVQCLSEGLHCGLWTIQWSAQPTHCWWWGHAALFVNEECPVMYAW